MNTVLNRMGQETPKFFKKVRNIGLILTAIAGGLAAAPIALPAILIKIAGYLAVAGTVASVVSQATVINEPE